MLPNDETIGIDQFGEDHWSTLGYMASVIEDCSGFQVGFDGRMRQGRRNYRVMQEQCAKPKRPGSSALGVVMDKKYSSRLKSGEQVDGHDDWHCVQDMVAAGLAGVLRDGVIDIETPVEPGVTLGFTTAGWKVAHRLREHKASGGRWKNFEVNK